MEYLFDYHVHTTYSTDGHSTMLEVCKSAVKNGLREIAITDHFEPTKGNESYPQFKANEYRLEIEELRERFKGKLKIKMGVELGQPHLFLDTTREMVNSMEYDYIIGSAHKLPDGMDFSEYNYSRSSMEEACGIYLKQVESLAKVSDFDCVGHVDLVKRYSTNHYKTRVTLMTLKELAEQVFSKLILNGRGIEINTSGLRQSPMETMPGVDVLKLYHELGGEILTMGSDSHHALDVAKGLDIAVENARQAGFRYLTLFNKRKPEFIKISQDKDFFYISNKKTG